MSKQEDLGEEFREVVASLMSPITEGSEEQKHKDSDERSEGAHDGDEPAEWEVAAKHWVNVRGRNRMAAEIIRRAPAKEIFIGQRVGPWVKLLGQEGYIIENLAGWTLVKRRPATYTKVTDGTCAEAGKHPITQAIVCEAAADAVGIKVANWTAKLPHMAKGCSAVTTSASTGGNSKKLLFDDERSGDEVVRICSNQSYPNTFVPALPPPLTLFCWQKITEGTYEVAIMKEQYRQKVSVFACEDWAVLSDAAMKLGSSDQTIPLGPSKCNIAWWGSWYNTKVFVRAWQTVLDDGRYKNHDWMVKVDPDAVWFPSRLKLHIRSSGPYHGVTAYFKNAPGPNDMLGPIEVFSKNAVERYKEGAHAVCFAGDLGVSGEDGWINACMQKLNVPARFDLGLLDNTRGPCTNPGIVCYHPHKTVGDWNSCLWR